MEHMTEPLTFEAKLLDYKSGSPEWFHAMADLIPKDRWGVDLEGLRADFNENYSPDKLSVMSGAELLERVFGKANDCMIRILMFDDHYRWFGACGKYKYLSIIYQKDSGSWVYNKKNIAQPITEEEAVCYAEEVRNQLLDCINEIDRIRDFHSITQYNSLERAISHVFFYKHAWVLKYYQMLYPHIFPGMYADDIIVRAIEVLGLPYHGKTRRIQNMGELALFTRRCDVNNIVFNTVYADKWGWLGNASPCENAIINNETAAEPISNSNLSYYRLCGSQAYNT